MDPRGEALEITGGRFDVRVHEPSPPTITESPFVADLLAPSPDGRPVLSPVSAGDVLWDDLAPASRSCARSARSAGSAPTRVSARRREGFAADARRAAPASPSTSSRRPCSAPTARSPCASRAAVSRRRSSATTCSCASRATCFTCRSPTASRAPSITNLADAAGFVGFDLTRFDLAAADEPLAVDAAAGALPRRRLRLRVQRARGAARPGRRRRWSRAWSTCGPSTSTSRSSSAPTTTGCAPPTACRPGDDDHPEPYAYVAPWTARPTGELWQADGFAGAQLTLSELQAVDDQRATALAFFEERLAALVASGPDRQTH